MAHRGSSGCSMTIEQRPRLTKAERKKQKVRETKRLAMKAAKYAAELAKAPAWTAATSMVYSRQKVSGRK